MTITVWLHPLLRRFVEGQDVVKVSGDTVIECIDFLDQKYPGFKNKILDENGSPMVIYNIYVNEERTDVNSLTRKLNDNDKIVINMAVYEGG